MNGGARAGIGLRSSIWGPVAVCVLALVASAVLPHADIGHWHMPVKGSPWLAAPSWPVPALRGHAQTAAGSPWAGWAPSWPVPALRHGIGNRNARTAERPVAGMIRRERAVLQARTFASVMLALVVAGVVASSRLVRSRRWPARRVLLARTVTQLAERGVAHSHIARRAGLPRDAVRTMLCEPVTRTTRRHA